MCGYDTYMYRILVGKPKSKRSFEEIGGDGRITLKSVLERHKLGKRSYDSRCHHGDK